MSSEDTKVEAQEQNVETTSAVTPGKMLRAGRERLGLSQQDMADKLFLRLSNIQSLEADQLDDNTSITFTKGYVRIYAKNVGIDDKKVIEEFEKIHTAPKQPAKLQSFSKRVAKQAHDDRWMMVTWIILLLLVAGVVVWWYQQADDDSLAQAPPAPNTTSERSATGQSASPRSESQTSENRPVATPAVRSQSAEGLVESAPVEAGTANANPVDEDDAAAIANQQADAPAAPADESEPEAGETAEVVFTFGADCWVNIEDATGEAIAYGVKQAGRVMNISGKAPFEVTLGAPDNVTITYEGEKVDISSFQTGRTARFTLPM
ncbi:DUF4115 domain-containing protein [Alteromonas pelagimontana]|uniref:DUF4115 domain-containing protein n=1 Tax=Alteromonas pelagimontana TaxID=1858656 RepID=A0A6M4MHF3_9ALTE|nr:RodZ domain-containing protein [Alteromonas pelagimontana]QJR82040.1 DUF4115 domain-containing protein [Alteromonas pelagimontana]